jgi:hypothetical protein
VNQDRVRDKPQILAFRWFNGKVSAQESYILIVYLAPLIEHSSIFFLEQNFDSTWDERAQLVSDLIKDDESPINWGGSEMFGESKLVQGKNTVKLEFRLR